MTTLRGSDTISDLVNASAASLADEVYAKARSTVGYVASLYLSLDEVMAIAVAGAFQELVAPLRRPLHQRNTLFQTLR